MIMSEKSFDLIVEEETGGEAYYNKTEIHPDWPGGASGVTIGVGYDCGYETAAQIGADWIALPSAARASLQECAGVRGSPAHALASELHGISVPWDLAQTVFRATDVPRWEAIVQKALPNTDKLSGDSFGALVSLAFNRGASFSEAGGRYFVLTRVRCGCVMMCMHVSMCADGPDLGPVEVVAVGLLLERLVLGLGKVVLHACTQSVSQPSAAYVPFFSQ